MRSALTTRLSPTSRSVQDNLSDTSRNVIGAIFVAMMRRAVICAVLDSSMIAAAGPEPEDNDWKALKVQWREAAVTIVMAEAMLRLE